jgi:phage-related protein
MADADDLRIEVRDILAECNMIKVDKASDENTDIQNIKAKIAELEATDKFTESLGGLTELTKEATEELEKLINLEFDNFAKIVEETEEKLKAKNLSPKEKQKSRDELMKFSGGFIEKMQKSMQSSISKAGIDPKSASAKNATQIVANVTTKVAKTMNSLELMADIKFEDDDEELKSKARKDGQTYSMAFSAMMAHGISTIATMLLGGTDLYGQLVKGFPDTALLYRQEMNRVLYLTEGLTTETSGLKEEYNNLSGIVGIIGYGLKEAQDSMGLLLKRGIKGSGAMKLLTKSSLHTAKMMGLSASESLDIVNTFADWNQQLGLSAEIIEGIGSGMKDITRTSGLTGQNLVNAVKSSQSFLDSMRKAGTLSGQSAKNVMSLVASLQKKGVLDEGGALLQSMMDPTDILRGEGGMQGSIAAGAAMEGGVLTEFLNGTLSQSRDGMNKFAGGLQSSIEKMFNVDLDNLDLIPPEKRAVIEATLKQIGIQSLDTFKKIVDGIHESNKPLGQTLTDYEALMKKSSAAAKDMTMSEAYRAKAAEEIKTIEQQAAVARIAAAESASSQITNALAKAEKSGKSFQEEFGNLIRTDSFKQVGEDLATLMENIEMPELASKVKSGDATAIMQATAISNARELKRLDPKIDLEGQLLKALASGNKEDISKQFQQLNFLLSEKQKEKLGDNTSSTEKLIQEISKLNSTIVEKISGPIANFLEWAGWKGLAGIYAGLITLAGIFSLLAGSSLLAMIFGKNDLFAKTMGEMFDSAIGAAKGGLGAIVDLIRKPFILLKRNAKNIAISFTNDLDDLIKVIGRFSSNLPIAVKNGLWRIRLNLMHGIDAISDFGKKIPGIISQFWKSFKLNLISGFNGMLEFGKKIPGMVTQLWKLFKLNFTNGFNIMLEFGRKIPGLITDGFNGMSIAAKNGFNGMSIAAKNGFNVMLEFGRKIPGLIISAFKSIPGLISGIFKNTGSVLSGGLGGFKALFSGGLTNIFRSVGSFLSGGLKAYKAAFLAGTGGTIQIIFSAIDAILGAFQGFFNTEENFKGVFAASKALNGQFSELGNSMYVSSTIAGTLTGMLDGLFFGLFRIIGIRDDIEKYLTYFIHTFTVFITSLGEGIWDGLQWAYKFIKPALDQIIDQFSSIGESITKALNSLFKMFGTGEVANLEEALVKLWGIIKPVAYAIGILLGGTLGSVLWTLIKVFGLIIVPIEILINVIGSFIEIISGVISVIGGLAKILISPFAAFISFFTTLFSGGSLIDAVSVAFDVFKSYLGNGLKNIFSGFGSFFAGIGNLVLGLFSPILTWVKNICEDIIGAFKYLWNILVGNSIIPDLVTAIIQWFATLPSKILNILLQIPSMIANAFSSIGTYFENLGFQGGILGSIISQVGNAIQLIGNILGNVVSIINGIANLIIGLITFDGTKILSGMSGIWGGFKGIVNSFKDFVLDSFANLGLLLGNVLYSTFVELPLMIMGLLQNGISLIGKGLWAGLKGLGKLFVGLLSTIFVGIPKLIWNALKGLWNLGTWLNGLIVDGLKSIGNSVINFFMSLPGKIWNGLKALGSAFVSLVQSIPGMMWEGLKAIGSTIYESSPDWLKKVFDGVAYIGTIFNDGVIQPLKVFGDWISGKFGEWLMNPIISIVDNINKKWQEFNQFISKTFQIMKGLIDKYVIIPFNKGALFIEQKFISIINTIGDILEDMVRSILKLASWLPGISAPEETDDQVKKRRELRDVKNNKEFSIASLELEDRSKKANDAISLLRNVNNTSVTAPTNINEIPTSIPKSEPTSPSDIVPSKTAEDSKNSLGNMENSINALAEHGLQKGSLYTHDIHSEKLLTDLNLLTMSNISDKTEKSSQLSNILSLEDLGVNLKNAFAAPVIDFYKIKDNIIEIGSDLSTLTDKHLIQAVNSVTNYGSKRLEYGSKGLNGVSQALNTVKTKGLEYGSKGLNATKNFVVSMNTGSKGLNATKNFVVSMNTGSKGLNAIKSVGGKGLDLIGKTTSNPLIQKNCW